MVDYRPENTDPNRNRLTVGGDMVKYPGDCGTPTVELTTVKLLFNRIISKLNAKFVTIDIKGFYLNTRMSQSKYMRLKLSDLPKRVVQHYNLAEKTTRDGYVYVDINQGAYGLPQAGLIAQQILEKLLNNKGYHQSDITPGLWKHTWRPI